jgi:type IV pilus assembly protein PilO
MGDLFDKIAGLKPLAKVGILLGILALIAGGYWYFVYDDMSIESDQLDQAIQQAEQEKNAYELRKRDYLASRLEYNQLLDEQKEQLSVLPKKDDKHADLAMEQFITNVNAQVELAGLSKVASVRQKAVAEEMYERIPISMSLIGTYHQINRFFKNIGELRRIVTIADLQLTPAAQGGSSGVKSDFPEGALKADFVAQTFQFVDRPVAPKPAPGGTPPGGKK